MQIRSSTVHPLLAYNIRVAVGSYESDCKEVVLYPLLSTYLGLCRQAREREATYCSASELMPSRKM